MSAIKSGVRKLVATMVSVSALAVTMHSPAFAEGEDDDFEISPICRAKPWLPVCDPPESPTPPPQLPFPCDFLEVGCPWWQY